MPALQRLRADHAPAVLAFEEANRAFFAASVPDRGDAYFTDFPARHAALLAEQETGVCHFHVLVAEDTGEVLGRFNLLDVSDGAAELGFRLAEKATGRGLATATVHHLFGLCRTTYALTMLRARASLANAASRTVLRHTGFVATGEEVLLNGERGLEFVRELGAGHREA
ncbi:MULTISPECIES: GNAT family N-acetyltransferase [unclassified Streptomyces]|uniref:GNAT family N-acetyltransferase n=1 Tax=unclassified Streptomyces TaxID=2593676 RepID=UPI000DAE9906|nr:MULTISPECIES: GNAT family N-acetyltransferase [unclassified Streptomyces]PZT71923.1 GNAT family N-acetyltransferase [Streptomyces sp. AC1-42T]PZT81750.1 GNAT family N-acetyltransferase [Streptomyces sp. AC1-42W]